MIEFWEGDKKAAECPAQEVFSMDKDKRESFWQVQDSTGRKIRLRIEEGEK
jgi:hypothetical protein